jgi:hypothetical protein
VSADALALSPLDLYELEREAELEAWLDSPAAHEALEHEVDDELLQWIDPDEDPDSYEAAREKMLWGAHITLTVEDPSGEVTPIGFRFGVAAEDAVRQVQRDLAPPRSIALARIVTRTSIRCRPRPRQPRSGRRSISARAAGSTPGDPSRPRPDLREPRGAA